jgi:hypothetical protein
MISKVEKNRIIRLKRQANYLRARADSDELSKKQRTHAMATANAISWAVERSISNLEEREKHYIRYRPIDRMISTLRRIKYNRNKRRYDQIEQEVRDLYTADIMDHERTYDGQAKVLEQAG